jgi:hypothetical protein
VKGWCWRRGSKVINTLKAKKLLIPKIDRRAKNANSAFAWHVYGTQRGPIVSSLTRFRNQSLNGAKLLRRDFGKVLLGSSVFFQATTGD